MQVNTRKQSCGGTSIDLLNVSTGHYYSILQDTKENDPSAALGWKVKVRPPFLPKGMER